MLVFLGQPKLISGRNTKLSPGTGDTSNRRPMKLKTPVKPNAHKSVNVVAKPRPDTHQPHRGLGKARGGLDVTHKAIVKKCQELESVVHFLVAENLENTTGRRTQFGVEIEVRDGMAYCASKDYKEGAQKESVK